MTLLSDVVRTSTQVAGTPSRLAKVRELAGRLGRLEPDEIRIAIPYLSGEIRQGKLSLGYASLQSARAAPAQAPTLTLPEGFQRAEFLLEKGAIDMIVDRRQLRDKLHGILSLLQGQPADNVA